MKAISLTLSLFLAVTVASAGEPQPVHHGDASERLRNIMQELNLNVADTADPDRQPEDVAAADLEALQEAVEELLFHAELLTTETSSERLKGSRLVTFRAIASQLYTETLNIKQVAENYNSNDQELLYSAYQRLYETCAACHDLYRDQ